MKAYVQVIMSFAKVSEIDRFFTYAIPPQLQERVCSGMRVKVPFGKGNRYQIAYVIEVLEKIEDTGYVIKDILGILEEKPILSKDQVHLVHYLVKQYGTTYAQAIDTLLPPGIKDKVLEESDTEVLYVLSEDVASIHKYICDNEHKKTFTKQKVIIQMIEDEGSLNPLAIKERGISSSSLQTLEKHGLINKIIKEKHKIQDAIKHQAFMVLNEEQQLAYEALKYGIASDVYCGYLLQGVTGSGKTEVFLHAIRRVLEKNQTVIILVPEIALTPQTLTRFTQRFGNRVALTHSRMTPVQRQKLYMQAKKGEISIVIGPRSAVFMPLPHLGMIVVDEEHETTYKSEVTPKYHAVEVATERMKEVEGVLLLASATPSLETYYKVKQKQLITLELKKRATGATMPDVQLVDMRQELKNGNGQVISLALHAGIERTLKNGHQVMILMNRRGHSTFINCRSCGYVSKCKHCDIALTYHMHTKNLECHYCGSRQQIPEVCPSCGSNHIRFFGNGTEKVESYLNEYFGKYGVGRMDFDTTTGKDGHQKILDAFKNRQFNVLVGTQMIAKGHDFPQVGLVGIIAADMSLFMQDFRSEERTYQLLTQALGRAGRGEVPGHVMIQTYNPEHRVLQDVKNFRHEIFYEEELQSRKMMGYPPYSHIYQIMVTGKKEHEVIQATHILSHYYQYYNKKKLFRILGPSAAVVGKVADEYRWKMIIIGEDREKLMLFGKYCLNKFISRENTDTIKINWDIDPYTML